MVVEDYADKMPFKSTHKKDRHPDPFSASTETTMTRTTTLALAVAAVAGGLGLAAGEGFAEEKARPLDLPTPRKSLTHEGLVSSVSWSPDGKTLASAGLSETRLWDAATGKEKAT